MGRESSVESVIYVRTSPEVKRAFVSRAYRNGRKSSDVIRELVIAWTEGRVTITPHE